MDARNGLHGEFQFEGVRSTHAGSDKGPLDWEA
jgi:hypothetical protein